MASRLFSIDTFFHFCTFHLKLKLGQSKIQLQVSQPPHARHPTPPRMASRFFAFPHHHSMTFPRYTTSSGPWCLYR